MTEEEAVRIAAEYLRSHGTKIEKLFSVKFESAEEQRRFIERLNKYLKLDKDSDASATYRDKWVVIFIIKDECHGPSFEKEDSQATIVMDPEPSNKITVFVDPETGEAEILMEL